MKMSSKILAGLAIAAGVASPSFAADAISFDPDGPGGDPVIHNVLSFDWTPANTLAVGGNAAVQQFIATGTTTDLGGGISVVSGGVSTPFSVFYQAKLAGFNLVGGTAGSPFTPAGLNKTYEITAVARFDERVTSILIDNNAGTATVNFAHVTNPNEYLEIYHGSGAFFNAMDLTGLGFNDGTLILESDILATTFVSNFAAIQGVNPELLDQANGDNYAGQLSITGSGTTQFDGAVTNYDPTYFVDVLSIVGFENTTNGNQKLPFEEAEPSARFLVNSAGTALNSAPVLAGAGNPGDLVLGIGTINGDLGGNGGPSIQFQADVNSSFTRVPNQIPEPATALLALGGLTALGMRRRKNA